MSFVATGGGGGACLDEFSKRFKELIYCMWWVHLNRKTVECLIKRGTDPCPTHDEDA